MKRQNSQLSSTSRRDTPPESLRAKGIGCMSGIIHLLSKYQNRHKKSLTFGKSKQEKDIIVFSSSSSSPADKILVSASGGSQASPQSQEQRRRRSDKERKGTEVVDLRIRRISSDLPTRSPTLSAEIRRSNSVNSPAMTIGTSPALVARLMGLESVPAETSSSEKRRKLLGALEKCDNDLKALKEIIMAYRSPDGHLPATPIAGKCLNREKVRTISGRKCRDCNCGDGEKLQQQSAASVLNESNRLHLNRINRTARGRENGQEILQQQLKIKKPAVEEKDDSFFKASTLLLMEKKKKDDDPPLTWRSKAMGESLDEISNEISWGLKREMAKIGMALQHHIYRDLIDEMLTDMSFSSSSSKFFLPIDYYNSLIPPFEACRRRLHF